MRYSTRRINMKCCNCGKDGIVDKLNKEDTHPLEGWIDVTFYKFPEMPQAELCSIKCAVEYFNFKEI